MRPQPNQKPTSELQEKILKHICITANADYKTISKETDRDRITILQSLKPLIRHKYIRPVKLNPKQAKSKLAFKPTDKGTMYTIAYLGVDIDVIRRAQLSDNVLENYKVFEQEIPSLGARKQFEQHIGPKLFVDYDLFDENGKSIISNQKEVVKQGTRISLFEQIGDKHFNIEELFEFKKGYLFSRKAMHPTEVKILKEVYIKIRDNLNASLKQLSN